MKVLFLRSDRWDVGLGGPYVEGVEGEEATLPEDQALKLYGWGAVKLVEKTDDDSDDQTDDETDDDSDDPFGINDMTKDQLEEFAKKEFDVDLDKRKSKDDLRAAVSELIEGK